MTTWGHELALSVVFENGLQHYADSIEAYKQLPEAALAFLKEVPAAWDETRYVAGEPGRLAVLARRQGKTWYLGGINGEAAAKAVEVPLSFLGAGKAAARADVLVIADGESDRSLKSHTASYTQADKVPVTVRGHGGFVMRLSTAR